MQVSHQKGLQHQAPVARDLRSGLEIRSRRQLNISLAQRWEIDENSSPSSLRMVGSSRIDNVTSAKLFA